MVQIGAAVAACTLWTGVASPGLKLLPGLDGLSDESISISLQSAVLGIDDGSNRPAEERARDAAAVLGLSYAASLLSPTAFHAGAAARATGSVTPAVVSLGEVVAGELATASLPVEPGDAAAPVVSAQLGMAPAAPPAELPQVPAPAAARAPAPAAAPAPAPVAPPGTQTIEFTSSTPASALVGGTYTAAASASSGLPVKLSIAGEKEVCRISGSTVSFREGGTCAVEAHQPGSARYKEARARQTFSVGRAPQAIVFSSTPPAQAVAAGPTYTVAATAGSGLPVSFAAGAGSSGVCKVSGSTVSLVGAGTCTVEAEQTGNGAYERAPRVRQSFAVVAAPLVPSQQSISFTSTAPALAVVGGPIYSVAAAATSGLAVSFAAASSSAGVCTVSGSVVAFVGQGTCTVTAHQGGDEHHLAAPTSQQAFPVGRAPQAVSFSSSPPAGATAGSTSYAVTAAATSGLPVSITVAQASASVCAISGTTVTAIDAGTCTIEASQPGDQTFHPATQVQQSFAVGSPVTSLSDDQTIAFTSTPPAVATIGDPAYAAAATASSGLPVAFSASAGSAGVCSVSGATVALLGAGTCTILADQAGSVGYHPAAQAQQSFSIGRASQAISFTSSAPGGAVVGGPDYTVAAAASSGLSVVFTIASASAGVCVISGVTVSLVGVGTCTVNADQGGNRSYLPAPQVQQSFTVARAPQSIVITSTPPLVDEDVYLYRITATATSGLTVTFSIASQSADVCWIFGSWVYFHGDGSCVVRANQAGNANYLPAPQVQQTIAVTGHD